MRTETTPGTERKVRTLHHHERLPEQECLSGYIVDDQLALPDLLGSLAILFRKLGTRAIVVLWEGTKNDPSDLTAGVGPDRMRVVPWPQEGSSCGVKLLGIRHASNERHQLVHMGVGGILHPSVVATLFSRNQAEDIPAIAWWELSLASLRLITGRIGN